jgi:energy-coupling factor transporter ATP-binding protein EcfA2
MSEFEECRLSDLVEVPQVRTVIRIGDADNPDMQDELISSFVFTMEVEESFEVILTNIAAGSGKGYFLYGNFGSGKSHFLTCLSLALRSKDALAVLSDKSFSPTMRNAASKINAGKYLVVNLSLVNYSATERLEEIVLSAISGASKNLTGQSLQRADDKSAYKDLYDLIKDKYQKDLNRFLAEKQMMSAEELFTPKNTDLLEQLFDDIGLPFGMRFSREGAFSQLKGILRSNNLKGLMLIIDELSEFLRSKSNARAFNEDIRFLQFLAESAEELPCWIVAALQDKIEETGEIAPELFTKITDRYRTRFRLTGAHVKELIDKRLIVKKPGAQKTILDLYEDYKKHFTGLPFDEEEFLKVYPVHPYTVALLDNLRNLFSQHRGVVDFIHYQLKGDPEQNMPGIMHGPCDALLSADKIFDHFRNRIREISELNPYSEQVFDYFEKEIPRIFNDQEDEQIALRIIRILILGAIAPVERRFSVREVADFLMHKISCLDPEINYVYVLGLLDALKLHGAYIDSEANGDELEQKYFISLESDVNLTIQRRLQYLRGTLFEDDARIFDRLGGYVNESYLPIKDLLDNPVSTKSITWHNTERKGKLILNDLRNVSYESLAELTGELSSSDLDIVLILAKPLKPAEQEKYLRDVILPELYGNDKASFIFWLPRPIDEGEIVNSLKEVLVFDLLKAEFAEDSSDTGKKVNEIISMSMPDKIRLLAEVYKDAYFGGTVLTGGGDRLSLPDSLLPFDKLLQNISALMLSAKYPKHAGISPSSEIFMQNVFQKCIDFFLKPEQKESSKVADFSAVSMINNFLKPMGLVKGGEQKGYRLNVEPKSNPLVNTAVSLIADERTDLQAVYAAFRKGEYGLTRPEFQVLMTSLFFSGILTPYQMTRRMALSQVTAYNFWDIDAIGKGQLIDWDLQALISQIPFLPKRHRDATLTIGLQHEIWEGVKDFKREWDEALSNMSAKLLAVKDYKAMSGYDPNRIFRDIEGVRALLDEIKVSYGSEQGLSRFLSAYQANPHFDARLARIERLRMFLDEDFDSYLFIYGYITDSKLLIPDKEKYKELRKMHEELLESTKNDALLFDKPYYDGFR